MPNYYLDYHIFEPIEKKWLGLKSWKRRIIRLLICTFLSYSIFAVPLLWFFDGENCRIVHYGQVAMITIVLYVTSLLLTALARNRSYLATLNAELKELSLRDSLTGLYNNRQFMAEQLKYLSSRAKRYDNSLVILFADLDGLKQINDTYSHLAGDSAIVATASRIQSAMREMDIIFRFGGDEFLIIASVKNGAETDEIEKEIEHIAKKISDTVSGKPIHYGEDKISLNISVGAHIINPENTIERELLIVDKKMYQAKEVKRNIAQE